MIIGGFSPITIRTEDGGKAFLGSKEWPERTMITDGLLGSLPAYMTIDTPRREKVQKPTVVRFNLENGWARYRVGESDAMGGQHEMHLLECSIDRTVG